MIYNALSKLSYKNNINQTQIMIDKIKELEKMVTVEKVQKTFFLVKIIIDAN